MTRQERVERYVQIGGRWINAEDKELVKAVELLQANYERSKKADYVQKPLAHALYMTWREIDKREVKRFADPHGELRDMMIDKMLEESER